MAIVPVPNFSSSSTDPTLCGNCLMEDRFCLHRVPVHRTFAYLCTSCVLRLHPQLFCPTCFDVYESSDSMNVVICSKCYSSSHFQCVRPKSPDPYICAVCIDPNSLIFALGGKNDLDLENLESRDYMIIDKKAATILFAAAKIVATLARKAADAAWVEAERKAALAARSRKIALEALEHLANLQEKEKLKEKRVDKKASMSARESGSCSVRVGGGGSHGHGAGGAHGGTTGGCVRGGRSGARKRIIPVKNIGRIDANRGKAKIHDGMPGMKRQSIGDAGRMDGPGDLLAASNLLELKEGKRVELPVADSTLGSPNYAMAMDVEESQGLEVIPGLMDGATVLDNRSGYLSPSNSLGMAIVPFVPGGSGKAHREQSL